MRLAWRKWRSTKMRIKILTLFPEMILPVIHASILGRAVKSGLLEIDVVNIRDYAENRHKNTDDYPFGGGAGMVMLPQPIVDAVSANADAHTRRIYLSPRGRTLNQKIVEEYAQCESLLFLCGHYEGVDQRALDSVIDEELSVGDYVLTGGELGTLIAVDAVARLVPGVLGSQESGEDESFTTGLLEYPQYTRPAEFRGMRVPEVLLNGNHAEIEAWRRRQSLEITRARRPDLLQTAPLTDADRVELDRMRRADEMIGELKTRGIAAKRMEMFAEAAFERNWIEAFVSKEKRASARKRCVNGRKHVGYLYQAFDLGYTDEAADVDAVGEAILYDNRARVGVLVDDAAKIGAMRPYRVLTAADFAWTRAVMKNGEIRCAAALES